MPTKNTLLIVDDEPTARDTLEGLLMKEDYELLFAESGREALNHLQERLVDVILLDVMMPEMDGFELCWYIKRQEQWRHIPIILVTALDSKEDLVRGLDAGADEFISKPVMGLELRARVRSMLRIKEQYDELQAALTMREELSKMLVQDMRPPLANIVLGIDVIRRVWNFTESTQHRIDRIYYDAHRLNSFIDDLLLLAKMKSDRLMLNYSEVDIVPFVEHVLQNHQSFSRSKNVSIKTALPEHSSRIIHIDKNLFHRLLDNLIANALEYSQANSSIAIKVEIFDPDKIDEIATRIQVADNGESIPKVDHYRIFEEFQVAPLKQKGISRASIGLAFCKMVAKAHGGTIYLQNNEPEGCIFTVEI